MRRKPRRLRIKHKPARLCHWCGRAVVKPTVPNGKPLPANAATRDHLETKLMARLAGKNKRSNKTVLACNECNQKRNLKEINDWKSFTESVKPKEQTPFISEARRRAAAICGA